jgi:hypothetical protein
MTTKLRIDLSSGILDVEGSEELVREIYLDFKDKINTLASSTAQSEPQNTQAATKKQKKPKPSNEKSTVAGKSKKQAQSKPVFDSSLDLTKLEQFFDEKKPSNHSEKILVFAAFLRDELSLEPCTVDQVYTCYETLKSKTKIPEAFRQAFINAKNKTHFIDYDGKTGEISITFPGNNHLNHTMGKVD